MRDIEENIASRREGMPLDDGPLENQSKLRRGDINTRVAGLERADYAIFDVLFAFCLQWPGAKWMGIGDGWSHFIFVGSQTLPRTRHA